MRVGDIGNQEDNRKVDSLKNQLVQLHFLNQSSFRNQINQTTEHERGEKSSEEDQEHDHTALVKLCLEGLVNGLGV